MQLNLSTERRSGMPQFISTTIRNPRGAIEPNTDYLVFDQRLNKEGKLELAFFVDENRFFWTTKYGASLLNGNDWVVK